MKVMIPTDRFNPIKTRVTNLFTLRDIFNMFWKEVKVVVKPEKTSETEIYDTVYATEMSSEYYPETGLRVYSLSFDYFDMYLSIDEETLNEGQVRIVHLDNGVIYLEVVSSSLINNNITLKIKAHENTIFDSMCINTMTGKDEINWENCRVYVDSMTNEYDDSEPSIDIPEEGEHIYTSLYLDNFTEANLLLEILDGSGNLCIAFSPVDIQGRTCNTTAEVYRIYTPEIGNTYPFNKVLYQTIPYNEAYIESIKTHTRRDLLNRLFNLLYERYNDWFIISMKQKGVGVSEEAVWEQWKQWCAKFLLRFNETYLRYGTLISIYEHEQNCLLRPVYSRSKSHLEQETSQDTESESRNRFNDTPQIPDDGTLEDDAFLSQFSRQNGESSSKGTGSSDSEQYTETSRDTIMARIDELQEKMVNLWEKWVDEFQMLFYN